MNFAPYNFGTITDWRTGETWGAARLLRHAQACAAMLRSRGAGPGHNVVIAHGGSPAFFGDLFGVWSTGACAVCVNPNLSPDELTAIAKLVDPLLMLDGSEPASAAADTIPGGPGGSLDDDALVLFTSGTTSTPKGVVHSFRSILTRVALNQAHIPAGALRKTLCVLPTHFGHGLIGNCLSPLLAGYDLVLAPAANLEVTSSLGEIIDRYDVTFMSSVPSLWRKVSNSARPPQKGSLVRVHVGSAPLSADLWNEVADWARIREIVNMYGITETANWLSGASLAEHDAEDGLVGRMWGGAAAVVTASGELQAEGEGPVAVQSPSMMTGYYKQPAETIKVMRDGWLHTGDIGRISRDGILRLIGRERHEINRGGIKIHPEDIDLLLERHELVREACTFAIPDAVEGESVGVAVSLRNGATLDSQALRRWCAERISKEKVPVMWAILDDIPKTERGKFNRDAVARHCIGIWS